MLWYRYSTGMYIHAVTVFVTFDNPAEPHGDMERRTPVVLNLPFSSRPNPFRSNGVTIRILSRFLHPPPRFNLVRLSVVMPFAGIGTPAHIRLVVMVFEIDPPKVVPLSWRPSHIMPMPNPLSRHLLSPYSL